MVATYSRQCQPVRRDGAVTYRLAGIDIDVPLGGVQTPGRHLAIRAENVHLGHSPSSSRAGYRQRSSRPRSAAPCSITAWRWLTDRRSSLL